MCIEEIEYTPATNQKLNEIPKQLEEVYSLYGEVEFTFGTIYPIEEAIEVSKRSPFVEDDWFCFGQDNYFSYWLCKKNVSTDDLAFTVWDHDTEENIDAPFLRTLEDLLEFLADEYNNCEFDTCSIVVTDCDSNGLKVNCSKCIRTE